MAMCINEVTLLGNLARDPEVRQTQAGKKVANMTVATSESWKDSSGERKERTEFHRVSIFAEGLVGVVERFLSKGSKVYVRGQLQTRKWTDNNGVEKFSTEVVLQGFGSSLILLDGKRDGAVAADEPKPASELLDDEIPFVHLLTCAATGAFAMLHLAPYITI